jgi:hypothetical protein
VAASLSGSQALLLLVVLLLVLLWMLLVLLPALAPAGQQLCAWRPCSCVALWLLLLQVVQQTASALQSLHSRALAPAGTAQARCLCWQLPDLVTLAPLQLLLSAGALLAGLLALALPAAAAALVAAPKQQSQSA